MFRDSRIDDDLFENDGRRLRVPFPLFFTWSQEWGELTEVLPCVFYGGNSDLDDHPLYWKRPMGTFQAEISRPENWEFVRVGYRILKEKFDPHGQFLEMLGVEQDLAGQARYRSLLLSASVHGLRSYGPNESHLHHLVRTTNAVIDFATKAGLPEETVNLLATASLLKDIYREERHYFYRDIEEEDLLRWGVDPDALRLMNILKKDDGQKLEEASDRHLDALAELIRFAEFNDFESLQARCPEGYVFTQRLKESAVSLDRYARQFDPNYQGSWDGFLKEPNSRPQLAYTSLFEMGPDSSSTIGKLGLFLIEAHFDVAEGRLPLASLKGQGLRERFDHWDYSPAQLSEYELEVIIFSWNLLNCEAEALLELRDLRSLAKAFDGIVDTQKESSIFQKLNSDDLVHIVRTGVAAWLWINDRLEQVSNWSEGRKDTLISELYPAWLFELDLDTLAVVFALCLFYAEDDKLASLFKLVINAFSSTSQAVRGAGLSSDFVEDSASRRLKYSIVEIPEGYFEMEDDERLKVVGELRRKMLESWRIKSSLFDSRDTLDE